MGSPSPLPPLDSEAESAIHDSISPGTDMPQIPNEGWSEALPCLALNNTEIQDASSHTRSRRQGLDPWSRNYSLYTKRASIHLPSA